MKPDCIFCKIVTQDLPAEVVYEDETTIAFLDIKPVNPGHTLVIPKVHATDIFEIEEKSWSDVMRAAKKVAHALEKSLSPQGINLAMNNREGAGQVVFHAHVHVMPRFPKDGHQLWHGKSYGPSEAQEIAKRIRAHL